MRDVELGAAIRALRRRRGWRQSDLARRSRVSQQLISLLERGFVDRATLRTLRQCCDAIGMRLQLEVRWQGADLAQLLDANHATLQQHWKRRLERAGWVTRAEVSFSHYGDRGRYDLVAYHPGARLLLVVEIKTVIADLQGLLGGLDVKLRLGRRVGESLGWRVDAVVPCLIVADGRSNRRRIAQYAALFERYSLRGRSALAWLRSPHPTAHGLLLLSKAAATNTGGSRPSNRARVRCRPSDRSVEAGPQAPKNRGSAA